MLSEVPFIDIPAKEASIPGDGKTVITSTLTSDVARFIRRAIEDDERWAEKSFIVGDQATFNEIVEIAEEARGQLSIPFRYRDADICAGSKFSVTYNDISELRQGRIVDIPAWRELYSTFPKEMFIEMFSAFGLAMAIGDVHFDKSQSLNAKYPDIETTKLRNIIPKYWTGK